MIGCELVVAAKLIDDGLIVEDVGGDDLVAVFSIFEMDGSGAFVILEDDFVFLEICDELYLFVVSDFVCEYLGFVGVQSEVIDQAVVFEDDVVGFVEGVGDIEASVCNFVVDFEAFAFDVVVAVVGENCDFDGALSFVDELHGELVSAVEGFVCALFGQYAEESGGGDGIEDGDIVGVLVDRFFCASEFDFVPTLGV